MRVQETRVKEIMTSPVITIHRDASLEEAEALMEEHTVRRLPVIDDKGRLVGIISRGDLREAEAVKAVVNPYAPEAAELNLSVEEVMTPDPITISPDAPVWRAAELLMEHKIGGIPVLDEDNMLCGIITESDILRLIVDAWRTSREEEEK